MLEQVLITSYNQISNNAQVEEISAGEKINLITQTIAQCMKEIEELKENLNPMTPPKV